MTTTMLPASQHSENSTWSDSLWLPTTIADTVTTTATLTATANAAAASLNSLLLTQQQQTLNNFTTPALTTAASSYEFNESNDLIHNKIVQIFFCILYTTVFVLGVFGNVLVCYVVLRNRAMQTVTNIFITNLALSDILLCVLAVPFTPLYTFMGRWAFGRTLCHLVSFAQGCSIYISTLTLTSIAVDRYLVIIYPFHPRMKLSTCIIIIVSIWVVALLATLPYGMYMKVVSDALLNGNGTTTDELKFNASSQYELQPRQPTSSAWSSRNGYTVAPSTAAYIQVMSASTSADTAAAAAESAAMANTAYCEENWPSEHYRKIFGSLTTIFQFVLPFLIISICYIWVSVKLNARARAKPGSKSSRREEADRDRKKRTNRMLISMVAVFGLSWLPINLVNIFDDFYEKSNEWRFYTLFFFVAHSIAMSSTCYNPFLYAWLNENFRKEFKHVLPCFNPSNNNIINITRSYNRSERNTCGPRLHNGAGGGGNAGGACTDFDDLDENGVTQETCLPKEKLLIIPREATYGNGNGSGCQLGSAVSPGCGSGVNSSLMHGKRVDILLNDAELARNRFRGGGGGGDDDIDSGEEEQTVEMRFVETPFVSSDNTTGISMMETSTSNDMERSSNTLDMDRARGKN